MEQGLLHVCIFTTVDAVLALSSERVGKVRQVPPLAGYGPPTFSSSVDATRVPYQVDTRDAPCHEVLQEPSYLSSQLHFILGHLSSMDSIISAQRALQS
ncbi:hypothetical protein B0H16DRAFT_826049 [Mycena metata]|uniref:Uncharacterized protein n=1 Tax=Mycena metata TaxID=1033252 RepID=A0AAD7DRE5_9AGAR|nr:hypothetical protein B0H16DRAFT_826049 [Mycena metata]